jgi:hypothetical protein
MAWLAPAMMRCQRSELDHFTLENAVGCRI